MADDDPSGALLAFLDDSGVDDRTVDLLRAELLGEVLCGDEKDGAVTALRTLRKWRMDQ